VIGVAFQVDVICLGFQVRHTAKGLLSMANCGININNRFSGFRDRFRIVSYQGITLATP